MGSETRKTDQNSVEVSRYILLKRFLILVTFNKSTAIIMVHLLLKSSKNKRLKGINEHNNTLDH